MTCVRDIAIGAEGSMWVIGCNTTDGGFEILYYDTC